MLGIFMVATEPLELEVLVSCISYIDSEWAD